MRNHKDRTVYGEICDELMRALSENEGRGTVINIRKAENLSPALV